MNHRAVRPDSSASVAAETAASARNDINNHLKAARSRCPECLQPFVIEHMQPVLAGRYQVQAARAAQVG